MKPEIQMVPVDSLIPYARNARTHSVEQIAQIAASIREFGWTNPILNDGRERSSDRSESVSEARHRLCQGLRQRLSR